MNAKNDVKFVDYLPLFVLMLFSGNPLITSQDYSKTLLVVYTIGFVAYMYFVQGVRMPDQSLKTFWFVVLFIVVLVMFQHILLGFVSYPGVFALILKILLALYTLLYYVERKINFLAIYIRIIAFLVIVSLPFWIINHFGWYGFDLNFNHLKTFFFYTAFQVSEGYMKVRNSAMFWEPGAFSGYLVLALVFIALHNKRFAPGPFGWELFWIVVGILTSMSTTGFLVLGVVLNIYVFQNFPIAKYIVLPLTLLVFYLGYTNLDFMQQKIVEQYEESTELTKADISNTRFGAWTMDMQYIRSQPYTGNGLDAKTRYRFHPWITTDIGHGNGMSNFLVYWGIPFFLFWMICVYRSSLTISRSPFIAWSVLVILVLLLQGEQFLNFPLFLIFFVLNSIYNIKYVPAEPKE